MFPYFCESSKRAPFSLISLLVALSILPVTTQGAILFDVDFETFTPETNLSNWTQTAASGVIATRPSSVANPASSTTTVAETYTIPGPPPVTLPTNVAVINRVAVEGTTGNTRIQFYSHADDVVSTDILEVSFSFLQSNTGQNGSFNFNLRGVEESTWGKIMASIIFNANNTLKLTTYQDGSSSTLAVSDTYAWTMSQINHVKWQLDYNTGMTSLYINDTFLTSQAFASTISYSGADFQITSANTHAINLGIDNMLIQSIPEPASALLIALAAVCGTIPRRKS